MTSNNEPTGSTAAGSLPHNTWDSSGDEATQVLRTPDADRTMAQPAARPYAAMSTAPSAQSMGYQGTGYPSGAAAGDVAVRDHRGTTEWDLAMSRMNNKPLTDFGLLLLRLCSLPLPLHGVHKALDFGGFVNTLRGNAIGAMAPEIFGGLVVAGQIFLPILILVGLGTRLAGLLQAVMMGCVYAFFVLANNPLMDPKTGGLSGEAALAYAALALPLFFTGAGRFSLDHAMGGKSRERRAEKAIAKRNR